MFERYNKVASFHCNHWLFKLWGMRKFAGITLGRWVFFRGGYDEGLVKHELVHVWQQDRDGVLFFYIRYAIEFLYYWLRHDWMNAYRKISYEVEAYKYSGRH